MAAQISGRNLFNANPPEDSDAGIAEGDGEDLRPGGQLPGPYDDCEEAKSSLSLVATLVLDPPEQSVGIFREGRQGSRLRGIDEEIEEGASLIAVYRERAVLLKGGRYECLQLGQKAARAGRGHKPSRGGRSGRSKGSKASASKNIKDGIVKTGENRHRVDKAMLDEQLADLGKLSRQARVVPHYKNGKQMGFKVARVKSNSLYYHLGLRRGDVLMGVNGEELNSPNKALKLLEQLENARDLNINVERRGKKMDWEFNIR